MKVINIHKRLVNQPKHKVIELLSTLATANDRVWPHENWPAIRFKNGLFVGEKGGHGPIRYQIEVYDLAKLIQFRFLKPKGFNGIHKFEIKEMDAISTEIKHTIDMTTDLKASLMWLIGIRWLHDALIEDAFDKIENHFSGGNRRTEWRFWVKFLRRILS
jgi:hypothetical protein